MIRVVTKRVCASASACPYVCVCVYMHMHMRVVLVTSSPPPPSHSYIAVHVLVVPKGVCMPTATTCCLVGGCYYIELLARNLDLGVCLRVRLRGDARVDVLGLRFWANHRNGRGKRVVVHTANCGIIVFVQLIVGVKACLRSDRRLVLVLLLLLLSSRWFIDCGGPRFQAASSTLCVAL